MTDEELTKIEQKVCTLPEKNRDVARVAIQAVNDFELSMSILDSFASEKAPVKPVKPVLERVQGDISPIDEIDIDELKIKIDKIINRFCEKNDIESLTKATQRQFTYVCSEIGRKCFKNTGILKDHKLQDNGSALPFRDREYDLSKVIVMIDLYDSLCNQYNKAFLHDALSSFLGMAHNTLIDNAERLSALGVDIYKKREESLASGIVDPNAKQVTGSIAALNHWHNWVSQSSKQIEVKHTAVIYPSFGDLCQPKQIEQSKQEL